MTKLIRQRWTWPIVFLSLMAVFVAAYPAQAQQATVRLEVPSRNPRAGGGSFDVDVVVDNVTNLGAFQFELTYDQDIVEVEDVQEGPFLGSSGRTVDCLPSDQAAGSALLTCVTLGATPAGPNGSGVLAVLTFKPVGLGISPLHLQSVQLTDPPANPLAVEAVDSSITVEERQGGGFAWALWGPVIGGVAAVVAVAAAAAWWFRRQPRLP